MHRSDTGSSGFSLDTPVNDLTLHEKVEQVALHAEWLKNNQKVLTDLYEHFSMVGSDDPELPGDYRASSVVINYSNFYLIVMSNIFNHMLGIVSKFCF